MTFTFTPPIEAPCVLAQLGSIALDQTTADGDGITWGVEQIEGWWDTTAVRVEQIEIPTGAVITVARQQARAIVLTGFAFVPSAVLGNLAYTAMNTLKAVARPSLFVPIALTVVDPAATLQAQVRLAGQVRTEIMGELRSVRFQVPLTAADPVLVTP